MGWEVGVEVEEEVEEEVRDEVSGGVCEVERCDWGSAAGVWNESGPNLSEDTPVMAGEEARDCCGWEAWGW